MYFLETVTKETGTYMHRKVSSRKIATTMSQRERVLNLYKTLLYMGRDYPQGFDYFRSNLKKAFSKNKFESDPEKIEKMIERGQYVVKEIEALYMLKKYRTMKRRYYDEPSNAV